MNKFLFLSEMENAGFNSQRSFAKKANISYKVLCNHINGVTKVSTDDVVRYCNTLNLKDPSKIINIFLCDLSP